jgi:hypothetical protein
MATINVRSVPSTRVQIRRRWGFFWLHENKFLNELHTAHSRPTFCEHRESGRASLRNRRPQSYTCTGVWAIRFLGAYSRLLAPSAQPTLTQFFFVGAVHGTTLRTSACIDCVRLHQTYTRDVSCEWNYWYLEHRSLHEVHSVLRICIFFTVVYCLCE